MKYEFIENHRSQHRVQKMCQVLKVNESGYYRWLKKTPSKKETEDQAIASAILEIEKASGNAYGATRVQQELEKKQISCSISRITRLMSDCRDG